MADKDVLMRSCKSPMISALPAALLAVAVLLVTRCVEEANPYRDQSRAGIVVAVDSTLADTLTIFSTASVQVDILLPDLIDSVTISAPGNRLWTNGDTVVPVTPATPNPLTLNISLTAAGETTVSGTAHLADGTTVSDTAYVASVSPLGQADLHAVEGDTVHLRTAPVADPVLYVWDLPGSAIIYSDKPETSFVLTRDLALSGVLTSGGANLFVTAGGSSSAPVGFGVVVVVVSDTTAPTMRVLADSMSGEHIYTGRDDFTFALQASDTHGRVVSATLDDATTDSVTVVDQHTSIFYWTLFGVSELGDVSRRLVVTVRDGDGNERAGTFYLHYDSTLDWRTKPRIIVRSPDAPVTNVPVSPVRIDGIVRDARDYDSVALYLQVNSLLYPTPQVFHNDSGSWSWTIALAPDTNLVTLRLKPSGVQESFRIVYDPTTADNSIPTIVSIDIGGHVSNAPLYIDAPSVTVTVTAFDIGSDIRSVTVGGIPAAADGANSYSAEIPLEHRRDGNDIAIMVTDSAGNSARETRLVYRNALPHFVTVPSRTHATVGRTVTDTVLVNDADGDSVSITVTVSAATGTTTLLIDSEGAFSWTPAPADTAALASFKITALDGYQSIDTTYPVAVSNALPPTARFVTDEADFPAQLVVGRDTLRLALSIDQPASSGSYFFTARVESSGLSLIDDPTDTNLVWIPSARDTGLQRLTIVVRSPSGTPDTLSPAINVLPQIRASFVNISTAGSESTSPCTAMVRLSRPNDVATQVTFTVDTTADARVGDDWHLQTEPVLTFEAGITEMPIVFEIVDDTLDESDESIVLRLSSVSPFGAVGSSASFVYHIQDNNTTLTPADTPAVAFTRSDSTCDESVGVVRITVALSEPAPFEARVDVVSSGTATPTADYTVSPASLTFLPGEIEKVVELTVVDDTICEQSGETITLSLFSPTNAKLDSAATYTLTIQPSDQQNCGLTIAYIVGQGKPEWIDSIARDTLRAAGYDVITVRANGISTMPQGSIAAIFVSQTVGPGQCTQLTTMTTPVVCASSAGWVELGLCALSDTGRSLGSSVWLAEPFAGLASGDTLPITTQPAFIPWLLPVQSARSVARLVTAGQTPADGPVCLALIPDSGLLSSGNAASEKRAAISMTGSGSDAAAAIVDDGWWQLLKSALRWATSSD